MSSYAKGRRLEYRVRDLFRKNGFIVIRSARSMPVDLVCMKNEKTLLIECKERKKEFNEERRGELLKLAKIAGTEAVLAYKNKRKILLLNAKTNSHFLIEDLF